MTFSGLTQTKAEAINEILKGYLKDRVEDQITACKIIRLINTDDKVYDDSVVDDFLRFIYSEEDYHIEGFSEALKDIQTRTEARPLTYYPDPTPQVPPAAIKM